MGLIVVNQTDAKQSIVLESTPEGVTGGYYDQNGNWNEFGGGGGGDTFTSLKVEIGKGFSGSDIIDNPNRALIAPLPVNKTDPIILFFPPGMVGVLKPCDEEGNITGETVIAIPIELLNTTISNSHPYYTNNTLSVSGCALCRHTTTSPYRLTELTDYPEYIRISYKKGLDGDTEVNASDVYGYLLSGGTWYKLEVEE